MVGISGGVPDKVDIRLGDIVVGTRVIQYDLGRIVRNRQIQRTADPRTLNHLLDTAVSSLRAKHEEDGNLISLSIREKLDRRPEYCRPTKADRLFSPTYDHISLELGCNECDPSKLVLNTSNPTIHYGTIASSNQVMRNSTQRDIVTRQLDAICFETEAAGLMYILPCLPIWEVCDYFDFTL